MTKSNLHVSKFNTAILTCLMYLNLLAHKGSRTKYNLPFDPLGWRKKLSRVMRKPAFSICENKDADQLRGDGVGPGRKPKHWFSHDAAH